MNTETCFILTTADEDVALAIEADLPRVGQETANLLGMTVTARHPMTDEVVATYEPVAAIAETPRRAGYAPEGFANRMEVVANRRARA